MTKEREVEAERARAHESDDEREKQGFVVELVELERGVPFGLVVS